MSSLEVKRSQGSGLLSHISCIGHFALPYVLQIYNVVPSYGGQKGGANASAPI